MEHTGASRRNLSLSFEPDASWVACTNHEDVAILSSEHVSQTGNVKKATLQELLSFAFSSFN